MRPEKLQGDIAEEIPCEVRRKKCRQIKPDWDFNGLEKSHEQIIWLEFESSITLPGKQKFEGTTFLKTSGRHSGKVFKQNNSAKMVGMIASWFANAWKLFETFAQNQPWKPEDRIHSASAISKEERKQVV